MATIHDRRYVRLIEHLVKCRKAAGMGQEDIARALKVPQPTVSKVERRARRIDVMELRDWLHAMKYDRATFLREVGWMD